MDEVVRRGGGGRRIGGDEQEPFRLRGFRFVGPKTNVFLSSQIIITTKINFKQLLEVYHKSTKFKILKRIWMHPR